MKRKWTIPTKVVGALLFVLFVSVAVVTYLLKPVPDGDIPFMEETVATEIGLSVELPNSRSITYTGMVSDSVFSVVWDARRYKNRYNVYYPVNIHLMKSAHFSLEIVKITPTEFTFKIKK